MSLSTTIAVKVSATRSDTLDIGTQKALHELETALGWASGTAVSQADEIFSDSRDITAAAFENFDLTSLSQLDAAGATIRTVSFAVVKLVWIKNISTAGYIKVGGGTNNGSAANAWALAGGMFATDASIISIPFGGGTLWYEPTGVAVSNGTADTLSIGAIGATQTVSVIIIGEST